MSSTMKFASFHVATVPEGESASNPKLLGHVIVGAVRSFYINRYMYDTNKYQINFAAISFHYQPTILVKNTRIFVLVFCWSIYRHSRI